MPVGDTHDEYGKTNTADIYSRGKNTAAFELLHLVDFGCTHVPNEWNATAFAGDDRAEKSRDNTAGLLKRRAVMQGIL